MDEYLGTSLGLLGSVPGWALLSTAALPAIGVVVDLDGASFPASFSAVPIAGLAEFNENFLKPFR